MTSRTAKPPLERYVGLLELLVGYPEGLSLHELSRITALPKPSLHRLLSVMQSVGLVTSGEGGRAGYRLGPRARRLVFLAADDAFIEAAADRQLNQLCRELDETCYIARLDGLEVRSLAMASPDHPWRGYVMPGKRMQHHVNASAKAIFAFQPQETLEQVLAAPRPRLTPFTKTKRREVTADYAEVRARRYATCLEEVAVGLAAFAVPIEVVPHGVRFSLGTVGPVAKIKQMIKDGAITRFHQAASAIAAILERR